jgi:proteasome alpha subunit
VESFGAMGGGQERLTSLLEERYEPGIDLAAALRTAASVIEEADERSIDPGDWEAGVLDRTRPRRKFNRLTVDDIASARA